MTDRVSEEDWREVERILTGGRQNLTVIEMHKITAAALEDQPRYTKLFETTRGKEK